MKKFMLAFIFLLLLVSSYGCQSIHVGGSGKVGTITGGGSVSIPVPRVENR